MVRAIYFGFLMPILYFLAHRIAGKPFKVLTPNYYHFIIE